MAKVTLPGGLVRVEKWSEGVKRILSGPDGIAELERVLDLVGPVMEAYARGDVLRGDKLVEGAQAQVQLDTALGRGWRF